MNPLRSFRHYIKASIVTDIMPKLFCLLLLTLVLCILESNKIKVTSSNLPFVSALSLTIGLLLVFRNNTSYDRYWEGRKLWAQIQTAARTFARVLTVNLNETSAEVEKDKGQAIDLLLTLCQRIKNDLRCESKYTVENSLGRWVKETKETRPENEPVNDELKAKVDKIVKSNALVQKTSKSTNTEVMDGIIQLGVYIQRQKSKSTIDNGSAGVLELMLSEISNAHLNCQRIARTPIPPVYLIHLEQILYMYLIVFPFSIVGSLGYASLPCAFVVYFVLLGIDRIGEEIENPFGYQYNDLPLDKYCSNIESDVR
ncbi:UPF0187-domain-containing protein, partial [Rozella allomycis CSF55]